MRNMERRAIIGLEPFGDAAAGQRHRHAHQHRALGQAPPADPGDTELGKARLDKDPCCA